MVMLVAGFVLCAATPIFCGCGFLINLNGDIMLRRPHTNILFLLLYRLRKRGDPSTFTTALGLSTAQHFCVNVVLVDDGGIRRPRPATSRRVSLSAAARRRSSRVGVIFRSDQQPLHLPRG